MLNRFLSTRIPRPVLRLHSGGKECTLCEEFKDALEDLQDRRGDDFEVKYVDIRQDAELKRLYQYDIPVLVLEDQQKWIMKHRIDCARVGQAVDAWHKKQPQS